MMQPEAASRERVLVSRQPIFDVESREFGYELLYRSSDEDRATFADGDQATAEVILNTFEIGLEELVGPHLAFINFDRKLILSNHCESLPKDKVVLELVETIEPDDELIQRLVELKVMGYRISVDSAVGTKGICQLLETANFVRFDIRTNPWPVIQSSLEVVRKYPVQLIAEKVETREEFDRYKTVGFDYFQGYFFCEPQIVLGRFVPLNRLSTLRLIAALNDPQIKINRLEEFIGRDVRLTYKLLRYANSAMCGLKFPVESIRHAIVLVGLQKIRIWASLLLLYGLDDKVRDVVVTGAVRARMCEQLGKAQGSGNSDKLFLVGMFSILDALVDQPMGGALATLPLSPAVSEAILYQKGELGDVLKCVLAYERRDWIHARAGVKLSQEAVRQAYVDAVGWALRTVNEFSSEPEVYAPSPGRESHRSR